MALLLSSQNLQTSHFNLSLLPLSNKKKIVTVMTIEGGGGTLSEIHQSLKKLLLRYLIWIWIDGEAFLF